MLHIPIRLRSNGVVVRLVIKYSGMADVNCCKSQKVSIIGVDNPPCLTSLLQYRWISSGPQPNPLDFHGIDAASNQAIAHRVRNMLVANYGQRH